MFNLSEIASQISGSGLLKTNKFMVEFSMPLSLQNKPEAQQLQKTNNTLMLTCEQVNLPGVGLLTDNIRRYGYGPTEKRPYGSIFTDTTMTFRGDGDGNVLRFMKSWVKAITNYEFVTDINSNDNDRNSPLYYGLVNYKYDPKNAEGYAVDIIIHVYSDDGNEVYRCTLREAYPILVGDIPLGWSNKNEYMKIPVIMTFFDWHDSSSDIAPRQTTANTTSTNQVVGP
jgi:hypothetical protein